MGTGDTIRSWLDPPASRSAGAADPVVRAWLAVELPRLEREGVLTVVQITRIAARYGVTMTGAATPAARTGDSNVQVKSRGGVGVAQRTGPALAPFLSDHGVSIILFLGAFLVVTAVAIYLGYNWGRVGGPAKLGALVALTVGFLGAAAVCLRRPSVRPAGTTFLLIGALLVPANLAAAYAFVFESGPVPEAAFWVLGAVVFGALYAGLSVRLGSRLYGALAALAPPVAAAAAIAWAGLPDRLSLPAAVVAACATLLSAAWRPGSALSTSARAMASLLVVVGMPGLVAAASGSQVDERLAGAIVLLASAATLVVGVQGLAAARAAALVSPSLAVLVYFVRALDDPPTTEAGLALVGVGGIFVAATRRRAAARSWWDLAGLIACVGAPVPFWSQPPAAAAGFGIAAAASLVVAVRRGATAPLYLAAFCVDVAYVKLLERFGSADSPAWTLGVALWPLALVWWASAALAPRRWSVPLWAAALATGLVVTGLVAEQSGWVAWIAGTFALAAAIAAWRGRQPAGVVATALWSMVALYALAAWLGAAEPNRLAPMGVVGWIALLAVLVRTDRASGSGMDAHPATTGGPGRLRLWARDWQRAAIGAGAVAALMAALLVASVPVLAERTLQNRAAHDVWLTAMVFAWLNLTLVVGAVGLRMRSGGFLFGAATALAPALLSAIGRLHPADPQAYGVPLGLYLLSVGHLVRWRTAERQRATTLLAGAGAVALVWFGLIESVDAGLSVTTLVTGAIGLALVFWGVSTRWRPLVAVGVATVVLLALRQLFDALHALPSWALLGGAGLALLAGAVGLLLLRERLRRAGRLVAERWSGWD